MERCLLLRGARQLLTLRGTDGPRRGSHATDLGIINDGAVLIQHGRVVSVGPSRRLENLAESRGAHVIEASGSIVMPGFIDSHSHLPAQPVAGRRFFELALRHGSTTLEVKANYSNLRLLHHPEGTKPRLVATLFDREFDELRLAKVARRKLARFVDLPMENCDLWNLRAARSLGLGIRLHAGLMVDDERVGVGVALGATSLDHLDYLNDFQVRLLAESPTICTVMPHGTASARKLMDHGAAVALATGFEALAGGTASMQFAVHHAATRMGLTLAEAITASTINGAHALALQAEAGSIEVGKRADLVILQVPDFREMAYYCGANLVSTVIHAGKVLV